MKCAFNRKPLEEYFKVRHVMIKKNTGFVLLMAVVFCAHAVAQEMPNYPKTARVSHMDNYNGVAVSDPYRWLEDDNSPETARWVEEQNRFTFTYLGNISFRTRIKERLEKLYNYPKIGAPFRRGEYYYFFKNDGLQNQSVIYRQKGLDGQPEVLLDPNKFSADGTSVLANFSLSKDGKYAAYGISVGGSDWQELHVLEVATRKALPDLVRWVKVSGVSWQGDGFYYSRYPEPEKGKELSTKNENHQVYYHKVSTRQSEDELVYEDKANPLRFHGVYTSEDERFAFLNISDRSKGKRGNAVFYRDSLKRQKAFAPIVAEVGDDNISVVDNVGDKLLLYTNKNAPNGRVVLFDPQNPARTNWKDILPERPEPLQDVTTAGGKIFVTYLKDVMTRAYVYSLTARSKMRSRFRGRAQPEDSAVTKMTNSFSTASPRSPIRGRYSNTTSPRRRASCFAPRRLTSSQRITRRGRSSIPVKTGPEFRCSSHTEEV